MTEQATLTRWMLAIVRGEPAPSDLTVDERAAWRRLAEQIAEIRARGGGVDVPIDVVLDDPEKQEKDR